MKYKVIATALPFFSATDIATKKNMEDWKKFYPLDIFSGEELPEEQIEFLLKTGAIVQEIE